MEEHIVLTCCGIVFSNEVFIDSVKSKIVSVSIEEYQLSHTPTTPLLYVALVNIFVSCTITMFTRWCRVVEGSLYHGGPLSYTGNLVIWFSSSYFPERGTWKTECNGTHTHSHFGKHADSRKRFGNFTSLIHLLLSLQYGAFDSCKPKRMATSLTRLSERNHASCNAVVRANDFSTWAHITSQLCLFASVPCWEQRFSTYRTTTIIQQTKTNNKQYNYKTHLTPLPPPGLFCYESFEQKKSYLA